MWVYVDWYEVLGLDFKRIILRFNIQRNSINYINVYFNKFYRNSIRWEF